MSEDVRDRQSDLAVMEMEEFAQKRLLQRLLESRDKVTDLANEARRLYVTGQIDERGRDTIVLYAVQDYLSAGWTLLLNHAQSQPADQHSEYLFERKLGEFDILEATIEFTGLYDVITTDEVFVREETRSVEYPQGPPREITHTESKAVPRRISWAACRLMDEFLAAEHGIELKVDNLDDSQKSFGFESAGTDELDYEPFDEAINGHSDVRILSELEDHAPA